MPTYQRYALTFPSGTTEYLLDATLDDLREKADPRSTIIITDDTVADLHRDKIKEYKVLTFPAGEASKTWETVEHLGKQLIEHQAHRGMQLVGLGGGVVTDITGFLASVYMRGIPFGFVPTTLLSMVDAAIGGKNGVNVGMHKNMLGTIRQPAFIVYHTDFLLTLPDEEWSNGFAEIIKYGHIADTRILTMLRDADVPYFQKHDQKLLELIAGCVDIKNKIVHADEQEAGMRKVLNFGHTAGHAFETLYHLPHGYAVSLGMLVATRLSEQHTKLPPEVRSQLTTLLQQYGLPVELEYEAQKVMDVLRMDKKRKQETIDFVLLEKPGVAITRALSPDEIALGLNLR